MTDGNGPMIIDSVWLDEEKSMEYISNQKGIMGRPVRYWNMVQKKWEMTGDWDVVPMHTRE